MRLRSVVLTAVVWAAPVRAQAQKAQSAKPDMTSMIVMMGLIMAIMYFMMIRPEQKRQKKREAMLSALQKNAKIVTTGGIHGTVHSVKDKTVMVKIADGVVAEFSRASVSSVLNDDGTDPAEAEKKR